MNRVVENKGDEIEAVTVESLDNIVLEHNYHKVDLMIMEIEGMSIFALLGMKQILSEDLVKNMIIEVHSHYLGRHHDIR